MTTGPFTSKTTGPAGRAPGEYPAALVDAIALQLRPALGTDAATGVWSAIARLAVRFPDIADQLSHRFASTTLSLGRLQWICWRSPQATELLIHEPAEKYVLWLPLEKHVEFRGIADARPQRVVPGRIGIMPALAETRCSMDAGALVLAIVVPQPVLSDGIEALTGLPTAGQVTFDDTSASAAMGAGAWIRGLTELAVTSIAEQGNPIAGAPIIGMRVAEVCVLAMLLGWPHSFTDVPVRRDSGSAPGLVRRAEAFIRAHAREPIGLDDIVTSAGCGARALQKSFQRFRQTTPLTFLRRVRLEGVHNALMRAEPGTTVASACLAWQFAHYGRFAALYRQTYGESPADALRRGRRLA